MLTDPQADTLAGTGRGSSTTNAVVRG